MHVELVGKFRSRPQLDYLVGVIDGKLPFK